MIVLMGDSNWWMPRWLQRATPRISIEGEEYCARRDAAAALAAQWEEVLETESVG